MSKATKAWFIVATSLLLIGGIIFTCTMAAIKWDFTKLSTKEYESNYFESDETIHSVSIDTDTADIRLIPSEDQKCSVICYEEKNARHSVEITDGRLNIKIDDDKNWYDDIGINFEMPRITVCLPSGEYGSLSISSKTGDIEIPSYFSFESIGISEVTGNVTNHASCSGMIRIKSTTGSITAKSISAESIEISVTTGVVTVSDVICNGELSIYVSTGKMLLTDVICENITSNGTTGDIFMENVVAAQSMTLERTTGDVSFDGCDAAELFIKTGTGDIEGSLLSEKIFTVDSETGKKIVPCTTFGGKCKITTRTGDINITLKQ